jgi:hypothetical protein
MNHYKFDNYGWFTEVVNFEHLRSIPYAPPPNPSGGTWTFPVVGELWPMFVPNPSNPSKQWKLKEYEDYSVPVEPTPVVETAPTHPEHGEYVKLGEFYRLIGMEKMATVLVMAKTDPMIEVFMEYLKAFGGCYLKHPETLAGLNYLVSVGVLTEENVTNITNNIPA